MFRVVGRDAQGKSRELSVTASTEEDARVIAQGSGLVFIDRVSVPPPFTPSRLPKLSGFSVGVLACLGCMGSVILGTVIGALVGHEAEPSSNILKTRWIMGGIVGAVVGLLVGVGIVAACYINHRQRS